MEGTVDKILKVNPNDREKVVKGIVKSLPPAEDFSTFAALAFVLGRGVGLPGRKRMPRPPGTAVLSKSKAPVNIIRSKAKRTQPRLSTATSSAIGSVVEAIRVSSGIPSCPGIAAMADEMSQYYLTHQDNFNLSDLRVKIDDFIDSKFKDINYLEGELKTVLAAMDAKAFGEPGFPPELIADFKTSIIGYYASNGTISNDIASKIMTDRVKAYNNTHPGLKIPYAKLPGNPFNRFLTSGAPRGYTGVTISPEIRERFRQGTYNAYVITTATKAIQDADALYSKQKDKKPNYSAVAAAVTAAAIAGGCSQTQALELSKNLTAHYINNGNFGSINYQHEMGKLLSGAPGNQEKLAEWLSRAALAAAALTPKDDAMRAGTLLSAKVFLFMTPAEASAMAASVAKARGGDISAMANAAAYASGICSSKQNFSSLAIGATLALEAARPDVRQFQARLRNVISQIKSGVDYKDLPENVKRKTRDIVEIISNIGDALNDAYASELTAAGTDVGRQQLVKSKISEGTAIAANTVMIGYMEGLSSNGVETLAKGLAHKFTLTRMDLMESEPLATTYVSLAAARVDLCMEKIREIGNNRGGFTVPDADDHLVILGEDKLGDRCAFGPRVTLDEVAAKASEEYERIKDKYKHSNTSKRDKTAYTEVLARKAAMNVYLHAIKTCEFKSEEDFKGVASQALKLADGALKAAEGYNNSVLPAHKVALPTNINTKLAKKIARSNVVASLIQKGIQAAGTGGTEAERAYRAIEAIINKQPASDRLDLTKLEARRKIDDIMESMITTPQEKGILVSRLLMPASKEFSQAIAQVVTEVARGHTLQIAYAGTLAEIHEEEALPSFSETDPKKQPKNLELIGSDDLFALENDEMNGYKEFVKERSDLPDDYTGINTTVTMIDTTNIKSWSFHFPGDELNVTHRFEDMQDFNHLIPQLELCKDFLTSAIFEKAIARFNDIHRNDFLNFSKSDRIPNTALTHRSDGSIELNTKGVSRADIKELFTLFADEALKAKNNKTVKLSGPANSVTSVTSAKGGALTS